MLGKTRRERESERGIWREEERSFALTKVALPWPSLSSLLFPELVFFLATSFSLRSLGNHFVWLLLALVPLFFAEILFVKCASVRPTPFVSSSREKEGKSLEPENLPVAFAEVA